MPIDPGRGRQAAGLVAAVGVLSLGFSAPPADLSVAGWRTASLFTAALVLWVSEALPIAVTALLVVVTQPLLGLATLPAAFASFISPVFFFVLVMFVIAQAFTTTGLDRRFALWLLERAGDSPRAVVRRLMFGCGALSTIVSDVPVCAIFMAIALGICDRLALVRGESRFAKALMLGIPIAALVGGVGTPAGSSINILGVFFIEQHGGVRVPFLHWMAIGVPMVLVLLPVAAFTVTRIYPPELTSIGSGVDLAADRRQLGAIKPGEIKVLAVMTVMIAFWIASSWFPRIDTVVVAVFGAAALFLPGMGVFESWKQAERGTGWDAIIMIGGVTSLGAATAQSGLAKWLVDNSLSGIHDWPPAAAIAAISAFTVVVHLVLPIAPVINAVMIPPIVLLAKESGHHPALYGLPVAFTASCAFLLPLDAVALVTYGKGYYRMFDMFLPGAVISVAWVALMTALLLALGPMLGLF
jgi:solute carrier family 13 (sodium-dependent dicarboxylate transporter), member 2/3/5